MGQGYIYVLANSSMPNVVKIGKTNRTPSERAQELSKVTGVPTPFIVVYEKLVGDPEGMESFVHTLLADKGYRLSENREFFTAPVSIVIEAILQAPATFQQLKQINGNSLTEEEKDDLDYPWLGVWNQANDYLHGSEDCFEDHQEALKLYKKATKLGCHLAYERIAYMHFYGHSDVPLDNKAALQACKDGASNGNYVCYLWMTRVFLRQNQVENARKCLVKFVEEREARPDALVEDKLAVTNPLMHTIGDCFKSGLIPSGLVEKHIKANSEELLQEIDYYIEMARREGLKNPENLYLNIRSWVTK
ncbi:GIY-YIG nuclease family protein [Methylomagnum sp.]